MNITLIGMPGSGKSYIGSKLAKQIGYELIELDTILEKEFKMTLQQVLDSLGESVFLRKQEEDAILYTKDKDNLVISPGGSIVYTENAMKHLREISKIIYLKLPFNIVEHRIKKVSRGIVGSKKKTLKELYEERET